MKNFIVIILLSIHLFSSSQFSQLLKLPLLVEHYNQHKLQNKNITIWSFLDMHYAHGNVIDADFEEDMKLPFKTYDYKNIISVFTITDAPKIIHDNLISKVKVEKKFDIIKEKLCSAHQSPIWQPPRIS